MLSPDCVYRNGQCAQCGDPMRSSKTHRNCRLFYVRPRHAVPTVGVNTTSTAAAGGPGAELSKLLKRFGIEPTPTCTCRAKAAQMDAWGPDECSKPERIEEVVAVMREEAKARGLPFLDAVGRLLVRRAIANARRAAAS